MKRIRRYDIPIKSPWKTVVYHGVQLREDAKVVAVSTRALRGELVLVFWAEEQAATLPETRLAETVSRTFRVVSHSR